jgi:hypothetical protein
MAWPGLVWLVLPPLLADRDGRRKKQREMGLIHQWEASPCWLFAVAEFTDSPSKLDTGIRLITFSINETDTSTVTQRTAHAHDQGSDAYGWPHIRPQR